MSHGPPHTLWRQRSGANKATEPQKSIYTPWITNHAPVPKPHPMKTFKLDMTYVTNDSMNDCHRSGWKVVVDRMITLYNDPNAKIIFDPCVDSTFGWNYNKFSDKLPYVKPWIGVVHHTPSEIYSEYNTTALLKNSNFLQCLDNCVCIIVFSKFMKKWFDSKFIELGKKIVTIALCHPTEKPPITFKMLSFSKNMNKMIVNIGAWLRDPYAIYSLCLNKQILNIQKAVLVGYHRDDYVIDPRFNFNTILNFYNESVVNGMRGCSERGCSERGIVDISTYGSCPPDKRNNKYVSCMINYLIKNDDSVVQIPRLSNDDYDTLLSQNIVFLNLFEASACNTVNECIVRSTPILVNRIDAVVEVLGDAYPLYYNNLAHASVLATDVNAITNAYNYLQDLNKTKFNIDFFIKYFEDEMQQFIGVLA